MPICACDESSPAIIRCCVMPRAAIRCRSRQINSSALLSPDGSVEKITAIGNVHALARRSAGENRLQADRAELAMVGRPQPRPNGSPRRETLPRPPLARAARTRIWRVQTLDMDFVGDGKQGQVAHRRAQPPPQAALDWEGPARRRGPRSHPARAHDQPALGRRRLAAKTSSRNFAAAATPSSSGGLATRPRRPAPRAICWRDFGPTGEWSNRRPNRRRHLARAGSKRARRPRCTTIVLADTVALSGSVELSDPDSVTTRAKRDAPSSRQRISRRRASRDNPARHGATRHRFRSRPGPYFSRPAGRQHSHRARDLLRQRALWQGDSVVEARRSSSTGPRTCSPQTAASVPSSRKPS